MQVIIFISQVVSVIIQVTNVIREIENVIKHYNFICCNTSPYLCFLRLSFNGSNPVSVYRLMIETSLVPPEMILAASNWIFSNRYSLSLGHKHFRK